MTKQDAEKTVRDIRRATRRKFSAEEKIRIVLEGLRGEETIAELCRSFAPVVLKPASSDAGYKRPFVVMRVPSIVASDETKVRFTSSLKNRIRHWAAST